MFGADAWNLIVKWRMALGSRRLGLYTKPGITADMHPNWFSTNLRGTMHFIRRKVYFADDSCFVNGPLIMVGMHLPGSWVPRKWHQAGLLGRSVHTDGGMFSSFKHTGE